ncbi:hypothetical protein MKW92_029903 [Papaver armeniacum]|nr:hypothetical protein MKW92_029903 [Papaver armeniacum]
MADVPNSESLRSTDVSDPSLDGSARKESEFTTKDRRDYVRPYAMEAISATKYELVEPGNISDTLLPNCLLHHIDFTAKNNDVADAPEEMFFAELKTINKIRNKNNGCCYCMFYNVQHPRGGGFMAGRKGLFSDEHRCTTKDHHDLVRPYSMDAINYVAMLQRRCFLFEPQLSTKFDSAHEGIMMFGFPHHLPFRSSFLN